MDTLGDFILGMGVVIKADNHCRGVGRPQVAMHSQLPRFLVNLIYSNIRMMNGVHLCPYVETDFSSPSSSTRYLVSAGGSWVFCLHVELEHQEGYLTCLNHPVGLTPVTSYQLVVPGCCCLYVEVEQQECYPACFYHPVTPGSSYQLVTLGCFCPHLDVVFIVEPQECCLTYLHHPVTPGTWYQLVVHGCC